MKRYKQIKETNNSFIIETNSKDDKNTTLAILNKERVKFKNLQGNKIEIELKTNSIRVPVILDRIKHAGIKFKEVE